jgi:Fur family ferric uptake transcriptional regulator
LGERDMAHGLRERGYKLTAQRRAILKVVQEANGHLTPAEVLHRGTTFYPGLGLTTVYRTLELLSDLGFVRRVHLKEGCNAYVQAKERDGHHMVCQSCHRVIDFPCFGLQDLVDAMARSTGFVVESHLLELAGLCPACQEAGVASGEVVGS